MIFSRSKKLFILLAICLLSGCSNTLDSSGETFSTEIIYTIQTNSHVNLWVENSYKTTVATLVDEVKSAGTHRAGFEAVNSNGQNLPEGIYTYRFETENISESRLLYIKHR